MKITKLLLSLIFVIILLVGWYLISPLFRVVESNEQSPLELNTALNKIMNNMSKEQKENFTKQMASSQEVVMAYSDDMPKLSSITQQAEFKEHAHEVQGQALIIEHDGKRTLRFEDFVTSNGPNLHIYLATDIDAQDFIDIGRIKATRGNVNYEIDASVNIEKYDHVLVWCVPFGVLFSYAQLV
jgi:hypothetical protein